MQDQIINKIITGIEEAIGKFQNQIPRLQRKIFSELQNVVKNLDTDANGKIKPTLANLKLVASLRSKLGRIIVDKDYQKAAEDFMKSYDDVEKLQIQYFATFGQALTPKKTLNVVKQMALESVANSLLDQGLSANVVDAVHGILKSNITTGGSYSDMNDQLRDHVLTNDTGEGSMERYTKQITTDSINQFSAQYHDIIAKDLNLNWGRYIGSNITTTREFCDLLTTKEWVHRSELPEVIKGHIDGHSCKIYKKTGLPYGMIPGTNESNFQIYRGGYNCGHQFFYTPDSAVPENIKNKKDNPVLPPAGNKSETITDLILSKNKSALDAIQKDKIIFDKDLLNSLPNELKIEKINSREAFYNINHNTIVIGNYNRSGKMPARNNSKYFRDTVLNHEIGHAIHVLKGIILPGKVRDDFKEHFKNLQLLINGKERTIAADITNTKVGATQDQREQLLVLNDILGSLTKGNFGAGHPYSYYKKPSFSEMEIFAHSVTLSRVPNEFEDLNPDLKAVIDEMRKRISEWL